MIVIDYPCFCPFEIPSSHATAMWPVSSCVCLARELWSNRCTTCRGLQPGRLSFAFSWSKSHQSVPSRSTLCAWLKVFACAIQAHQFQLRLYQSQFLFPTEGMYLIYFDLVCIFPWTTILLNSSGKPWHWSWIRRFWSARQLAESCFYVGVAVGSLRPQLDPIRTSVHV